MFRKSSTAVAVLTFVAAGAFAQGAHRVELTPTASYNFGGTIDATDSEIFNSDLEANDSEAFGVTLDIPLASWVQLEFLASRQSTELQFDHGLFGNPEGIADFNVTYYQVGGLFSWGNGQIHPFAVMSLGITELDPDVAGASKETRFSGSFGGGVKIFFNEHVGVRLEGRGYWTALDNYENDYYYDDCGCGYGYNNGFTQFQGSAGLILAF